MESKKLKCVRLTAPKRPVYEAVGDYLVSKALTKTFPRAKDSEDIIRGSVAVNLSVAQRQLHDAEQRLRAKRQFEVEQRKIIDDQWKELERKELEFREDFIRFNAFIIENEHKRDRALSQIEEQRQLVWNRNEKIKGVIANYQELRSVQKLGNEKMGQFNIYEEFLQSFIAKYPGDFRDILSVIKRYETLIHAKNFLSDKQQQDIQQLEKSREELRKTIDSYTERLQAMHTKIAILTLRLETAQLDCLKWEEVLEKVRKEATAKMLELMEVRTTCTNIYLDVCERTDNKPVYLKNYGMQFDCIKKALTDLQRVNRRLREVRKMEERASEAATASASRN